MKKGETRLVGHKVIFRGWGEYDVTNYFPISCSLLIIEKELRFCTKKWKTFWKNSKENKKYLK